MRWKPKNKRLIVSPEIQDNVTEAGLFIPDSAKEVPMVGKVESVGPDCKDYAVGQTVMFGKFAGSIINVDGSDYLILLEEDVFCSLEQEAA